jgi:hypothetical protein
MTGIVAGLTPPSAAAAPPEPAPEVRVVFRPAEPVGPLAEDPPCRSPTPRRRWACFIHPIPVR